MKTSSLYSVNWRDVGHGLLIAVGGAVIAAVKTSLDAGQLNFNWNIIGTVAVSAGVSYLIKKFFTDSQLITPAK